MAGVASEGWTCVVASVFLPQRFLLKECDFSGRGGPALAYILKKNPHNQFGADMKLYLQCQVHAPHSPLPSSLTLFCCAGGGSVSRCVGGGGGAGGGERQESLAGADEEGEEVCPGDQG